MPHERAWSVRIWRLVALSSTISRRLPLSCTSPLCSALAWCCGSASAAIVKWKVEPSPGAL
jgi:hypothetical protein